MCTEEPVLKDHPIGHENVVSQDKWSLVTGSATLKCVTFCQEYLVSQDKFYCIKVISRYNCCKNKLIFVYLVFFRVCKHVQITPHKNLAIDVFLHANTGA